MHRQQIELFGAFNQFLMKISWKQFAGNKLQENRPPSLNCNSFSCVFLRGNSKGVSLAWSMANDLSHDLPNGPLSARSKDGYKEARVICRSAMVRLWGSEVSCWSCDRNLKEDALGRKASPALTG